MTLPHQELNTSHNFVAASADDGVVLEDVRAVFIGGIGDLMLENYDGTDVLFVIAAAPVQIDVSPRRILETGTTATNIVLLY